MNQIPTNFQVDLGIGMRTVTQAAQRYECTHEFRHHVIDELTTRFASDLWQACITNPFEHGLVLDAAGHLHDGDLENWLNMCMERAGVGLELQAMEDSRCFFDRDGCWWPSRSYLLREITPTGDVQPYTARVATQRFVAQQNAIEHRSNPESPLATKVSASTVRDLERMPYRLTIKWKECPRPKDGDAPPLG